MIARIQGKLVSLDKDCALVEVGAVSYEIMLPGYAVSGWYGLVAPRGTPKAAIDKMHAAVLVAVRQPDIREKLLGVGVEATEVSPAEFGKLIDSDIEKWRKVAKPLNISME